MFFASTFTPLWWYAVMYYIVCDGMNVFVIFSSKLYIHANTNIIMI